MTTALIVLVMVTLAEVRFIAASFQGNDPAAQRRNERSGWLWIAVTAGYVTMAYLQRS